MELFTVLLSASNSKDSTVKFGDVFALVLAIFYIGLLSFPIIILTRTIITAARKHRKEKEVLLPRDYDSNPSWSRRVWVAWFNGFLFVGALSRAVYFLKDSLEDLVDWDGSSSSDISNLFNLNLDDASSNSSSFDSSSSNSTNSSGFISSSSSSFSSSFSSDLCSDVTGKIFEAVFIAIGTASLFSCYAILFGKLVELINSVETGIKATKMSSMSSSSSSSLSLSSVNAQQSQHEAKLSGYSFTLKVSIIVSFCTLGVYFIEYAVQIHFVAQDLCDEYYAARFASTITGCVLYVISSISFGAYAVRMISIFKTKDHPLSIPSHALRLVILCFTLCLCFLFRTIMMVIMINDRDNSPLWIAVLYYLLADVLPQILVIVLFFRNQKAIKFARKRRTEMFG